MSDAPDEVRTFLFEHLEIRGAYVHLHQAWQQMLAGRHYPHPVQATLGEMAVVAALIGANLKQAGRMTFQLKGGGPVNLLVLDCDEQLRLRGMARHAAAVQPAATPDLLGHGQLMLTLDTPEMRQPYQSMVPLDGHSIAAIFEHYLSRSEQLPTRLFLMANDYVAAGFFLQKMPQADQRDADGWNRIVHLAETVQPGELRTLACASLLTRLFPEEDIRLFDPRPVSYHCPEDWEKVRGMLLSVGREECDHILQEKGEIRIHDEICNHEYVFDEAAVASLFAATRPLH